MRNVGVFLREKVWLRLFSSQTFSCINTPTFLKPSHSSHLPAYEDGTESSETPAYKIQTPGNYPEKSIKQIVHLLMLIGIVNQFTIHGKICKEGTQIFVPTLCSEMQSQAVTVADGVIVVGEVKTSGGFDCISLKFRNNWLLANANPFSNQSQGCQNHQSTPHANIFIRNTNVCTFDT